MHSGLIHNVYIILKLYFIGLSEEWTDNGIFYWFDLCSFNLTTFGSETSLLGLNKDVHRDRLLFFLVRYLTGQFLSYDRKNWITNLYVKDIIFLLEKTNTIIDNC